MINKAEAKDRALGLVSWTGAVRKELYKNNDNKARVLLFID